VGSSSNVRYPARMHWRTSVSRTVTLGFVLFACEDASNDTSTDAATPSAPGVDAGPTPQDTGPVDASTETTIVDASRSDAMPIVATPGVWTYAPIAGMVCGNGSPTGVMVNPSTKPGAPLFLFLMGGGACWNNATCMNDTAAKIESDVTETEMRDVVARIPGFFDRTRASNALADAHYVFVPYCTGDIHAGNSQRNYRWLTRSLTIEHRGARNVETLLPRVAATFPGTRVILGGASAGGFGTLMNYERVRAAFPTVPIAVLDDSGPPIELAGGFWSDMQSAWNFTPPTRCTDCATDPRKILPYLAGQMGTDRFALLSYTKDSVIRSFTGNLVAALFERDLLALKISLGPNQKMFLVDGTEHVVMRQTPLPQAGGLAVDAWLTQFVTGDAAWATTGP
jgi:hypothetical protein